MLGGPVATGDILLLLLFTEEAGPLTNTLSKY